MDKMNEYEVRCEELTKLLKDSESLRTSGLAPSIFIDFDTWNVYSYFTEPASFEKHIPDGWTGHYCEFTSLIPNEHKYWLSGNKNLFSKEY